MKLLLPLFLALSVLIGACATDTKTVVNEDGSQTVIADTAEAGLLDKIGQFTRNDVQAAMRLAGDSDLDGIVDPGVDGDPVALQCYVYLDGKLGTAPQGITVAGVISGFQAARNIKRRVSSGVSDEFHLGCGPLINDVRSTALGIAARLGSGGVLPF
jgi:hypothetical protein